MIRLSWFRTEEVARERAHGDGMMVSMDSPEAFEEIVWMAFWEDNYSQDKIHPWRSKGYKNFDTFFAKHRDKTVFQSNQNLGITGKAKRYISKNNLNIARIPYILSNVKNSVVLLPFRNPYQHAASLLKQHLNFLKIHQDDPFTKSYMAGIGHFDFGENLIPVDFDNWLADTRHKDATELSFWLAYWVATYSHLLTLESERMKFIDFDDMCAFPENYLGEIAQFVQLKNPSRLTSQAPRLTLAKAHHVSYSTISQSQCSTVNNIYQRLKARTIIRGNNDL